MDRLFGKLLGALLLIACGSAALKAQQDPAYQPGAAPGNALERLFRNNYAQPAVRAFDTRGEETLDGMIRDGKLRITAEDAVRLALENNVDINVERYNPYLSLWGVEQGKAVLNPSLAFTTSLNRNTTPRPARWWGFPRCSP